MLAFLSPYLLGLAHHRPARLVMQGQAIGGLAYSLLTRYELGVLRVLPFRTHLLIDVVSLLYVATSPWLLGFRRIGLPHVVFGLTGIAVALLSRTESTT